MSRKVQYNTSTRSSQSAFNINKRCVGPSPLYLDISSLQKQQGITAAVLGTT